MTKENCSDFVITLTCIIDFLWEFFAVSKNTKTSHYVHSLCLLNEVRGRLVRAQIHQVKTRLYFIFLPKVFWEYSWGWERTDNGSYLGSLPLPVPPCSWEREGCCSPHQQGHKWGRKKEGEGLRSDFGRCSSKSPVQVMWGLSCLTVHLSCFAGGGAVRPPPHRQRPPQAGSNGSSDIAVNLWSTWFSQASIVGLETSTQRDPEQRERQREGRLSWPSAQTEAEREGGGGCQGGMLEGEAGCACMFMVNVSLGVYCRQTVNFMVWNNNTNKKLFFGWLKKYGSWE